jgi:hypothetical protein
MLKPSFPVLGALASSALAHASAFVVLTQVLTPQAELITGCVAFVLVAVVVAMLTFPLLQMAAAPLAAKSP